jgi:hypothetical protein
MKLLKLLLDFIKGLFKKPPYSKKERAELEEALRITKERDKEKDDEADRKARLSPNERRYEWLCSKGYTPYVHLGTDPKPQKPLSHYRHMVNTIVNLGAEIREKGKKVIVGLNKRNCYGVALGAYRNENS